MSRAFTKEIDDAPPPALPDRPVGAPPFLVTPRGAELLEAKLAELETAIGKAGDTGTADALARDQRYFAARHAGMQIVPARRQPTTVGFGVRATIRRRGRRLAVTIVGEDEAEPASGAIAYTSPLARALEGAQVAETIEFEAGGNVEEIEILEITGAA